MARIAGVDLPRDKRVEIGLTSPKEPAYPAGSFTI